MDQEKKSVIRQAIMSPEAVQLFISGGMDDKADMLTRITSEVDQIKADARAEGEEIVAKARAEAEEIKQRAAEDGERIRAEKAELGKKEGIEEARREMESLLSALRRASEEVNSAREELIGDTRGELIEISLTLAEKILLHQSEIDPDLPLKMAEEVLRHVPLHRQFNLFVNPADLELLKEHRQDLESIPGAAERFTILPDERVKKGFARLETEAAIINANLPEQIDKAREALEKG